VTGVIIHQHEVATKAGRPHFRLLCSDYHLGSANADHDAIVRDLSTIQQWGGKAIINGDVFDAIGPKDKRFDLQVLHPLVARKKDLAKAIVDLAFDLLHPYRHSIDVIGIGNHEEAWINYNHGDPVRLLIDRLNAEGASIRHGGFCGYIVTQFKVDGGPSRLKHKLYYLHGTGGDSPVTKGTIDINRKGRNWNWDCLTFGHKHNSLSQIEAVSDVTDRGVYYERRQVAIQTASYYRNYRQLGEGEELDQSYAASKAHPPKPVGGTFLILRPTYNAAIRAWGVRQDFASDLIDPNGGL
jgi:hypothetical protein